MAKNLRDGHVELDVLCLGFIFCEAILAHVMSVRDGTLLGFFATARLRGRVT